MRSRHPLTKIGVVSILIGLMANAFASNVAFSLLAEPLGARIRPMGEAVAIVAAALLGVCGSALAFVPAREKATRWVGIAGFLLGLTPFPLGLLLMQFAIQARQIQILP